MAMKRLWFLLLVLLALALFLAACGAAGAPSSVPPVADVPEPASVSAVSDAYVYEYPEFDLPQEPPLDYGHLGFYVQAAPDFLDAGQQDLYLRACAMAPPLFLNAEHIESFYPPLEGGAPQKGAGREKYVPEDASLAVYGYSYSRGRYQSWAHFSAVMEDIFTEECFDALNTQHGYPLFMEGEGGRLAFAEGARGANINHTGLPDEFNLISMTENEISFEVIGHYQPPDGGASYEEAAARPIKLVRTGEGWRVAQFSVTY